MKNLSINAQKLQLVLAAGILLVVAIVAAGAYFLIGVLDSTRTERVASFNQMQTLQQEVDNIKGLEKQLEDQKDTIAKAKQVFSTDKLYAYQDKVIEDLASFAKKNDMSLTSISFTQSAAAKSAPSASVGAAPVLVPFSVSLEGNSSYINVMSFLYDIEHSLTQLRIVNISLSPDSNDPTKLLAPSVSLEVYVRSGS